ncbi:MAG: hypothetical protein CL933_14260 [Deltaproteobacteria bacterium]|nr:hypothetical protein [Deltaproteobacteria bacterium]
MVLGAVLGAALGSGCSDDSAHDAGSADEPTSEANAPVSPLPSPPASIPTPPSKKPMVDDRTPEELVEAGRSVYNANCISCHSMNPIADGALGPAVAGASISLLEARVLRGEYPEGYVPKRDTRVMIPLPHLERKLPELAVYLDSLE